MITSTILQTLDLQIEERMTTELKNELRISSEKAGVLDVYSKLSQYIEKNESIQDELNNEIEVLETQTHNHRNISGEIRHSLVSSYESSRDSMEKYNQFKKSVSLVLDSRDQLEEQFKFAMNSSREIFKDQGRILSSAEKAERSVDEYIRSLKSITVLKGDFKELRSNVEVFKTRIVQALDQLLIFQNHESDTQRVDQFLGKIKIEMKGFEKVLSSFSDVVTQLDVTVTKMDMMSESREKIDLDSIRYRMESLKNNLDNVQFSASKITQVAHSKDEDMVQILRVLVANLKSEMKRINEMSKMTGMSVEHLNSISQNQTEHNV